MKINSSVEIWKFVVRAKLEVLYLYEKSSKSCRRTNDIIRDVKDILYKGQGMTGNDKLEKVEAISDATLRLSLEITAFLSYDVAYADFNSCITSSVKCPLKDTCTIENEELRSMQLFVFIVHLIAVQERQSNLLHSFGKQDHNFNM